MKFVRLFIALVFLLTSIQPALFAASDPAKQPDPAELEKILADFEKYATKSMSDWRVPGMAIAIVRGDDVIYEKAFGVKELGKEDPVTTDTVFQIGSTSKAFTAALVATLVDEGKLKWDDKVISHLDDFKMYDPWVTKEFMVVDLMAQRSGMPAHAIDTLITTGSSRDRVIDSLRYVKPATSFRSTFAYQNSLWLVAAKLVEKITGETWEKNIKDRIFKPLDMAASSTSMKAYTQGANAAALHRDVDGTIVVLPMDWPHIEWTYTYGPAGGINSNVKDISKWLRMQAQGGLFSGKQVIKEENVRFMHAPETPASGAAAIPGPEQYYCVGWVHREAHPYSITWHNGGTSGSKTMIAFVPEAKLGIVVLSNLIDTTLPESLAWRFFDMYFNNPKHDWSKEALTAINAAKEKAKAADPKQPAVPSPALALDRYTGDYSNDIYGTVNVAKKADGLIFTIGPKKVRIDLQHWDGNIFMGSWNYYAVKENVGAATFDVSDKGVVTGVRVDVFNEDGCGAFRKVTPVVVSAEMARSCEFDKICSGAVMINGVKHITYDQLQKLRKSGEKFVLADVLSSDDYSTGHIPGAISFPVKNINLYNAVNKIPMGTNVVVYCLDNRCPYSSEAAQKLTGYGYKVLAYKGGLDEWRQKGNALQK